MKEVGMVIVKSFALIAALFVFVAVCMTGVYFLEMYSRWLVGK